MKWVAESDELSDFKRSGGMMMTMAYWETEQTRHTTAVECVCSSNDIDCQNNFIDKEMSAGKA